VNSIRFRYGGNVATQFELRSSLVEWPAVTSASVPLRSDEDLVRASQKGDRVAFGELYRRYARIVHAIFLARVPPSVAEDLVQDVFLHALPRLGSLRDASRFGAWLSAIARNRAADFHRQRRPDREFGEDSCGEEPSKFPANRGGEAEALFILGVIRSLPETYRETLILRLVEGMTGPEIAARTGLTHGSVRVNLHRGMQRLRDQLGGSAKFGVPARENW
jgi:RNA polymerase sigma-70 factor, ECF subfamily